MLTWLFVVLLCGLMRGDPSVVGDDRIQRGDPSIIGDDRARRIGGPEVVGGDRTIGDPGVVPDDFRYRLRTTDPSVIPDD